MQDFKVCVVNRGRKYLYLRYICPEIGKPIEKSAKTADQKTAEREAGKWEAELREGRYQRPNRMTWDTFYDYYTVNALPALASSTTLTYMATLNVFARHCHPQKLSDVTTARVTRFSTALREEGAAEATVGRHLRQLKVIMRWAHGQGLLPVLPTFNMPKRVKGAKLMRGRPICEEEFERMLKHVPAVVENAASASWEFYLRGLWHSGLRLSESLALRWDDAPGGIVVDLSGRRPMLRIPAEAQKANRDELLPMTPEFAALLAAEPERDRRGRVFKLLANDGTPLPATRRLVGPTVSAIGEKAGVVVDERQKGGETVRKFASAHDLRRAFGKRWSRKVSPTTLRDMMRHADIHTTMKYYVGQDAEESADAIWAAAGDTLGDTSRPAESESAKNASGDDRSRTCTPEGTGT